MADCTHLSKSSSNIWRDLMNVFLSRCDIGKQAKPRGGPRTLIIGTLIIRITNKRMRLTVVAGP